MLSVLLEMHDRQLYVQEHQIAAHEQLYQDAIRRRLRQDEMTHWYPEDFTFQPTLQTGGHHPDSTKVMAEPLLNVSDRSVLLPLTALYVCAHVCLCPCVSVLISLTASCVCAHVCLCLCPSKRRVSVPVCVCALTPHSVKCLCPCVSVPMCVCAHVSLCSCPSRCCVSVAHYPPSHLPDPPPCPPAPPSIYLPSDTRSEPAMFKPCTLSLPTNPKPLSPLPPSGC